MKPRKHKKKRVRSTSSPAAPPQDQVNLLLTYYQAGSLPEAEALATSLTQQFPKHPFGWTVLAAVLNQVGRLTESLSAQRRSVELSPQDAEAHYNLGITLSEVGRNDEAKTSYQKSIALKPDSAEAHFNLGNTLIELGELGGAESSYRQSIALKPEYAQAHSNLGNTLRKLERLDDAEASLRKAVALKPDLATAHCNLGGTLQELGMLAEAEASYKKAIALTPDYAQAHSNLGATFQKLGRLEEAQVSYKQAIAIRPDCAEVHNALGNTLKELGRLEEAEAVYRQAITLQPESAGAHSNLGATLHELGKLEEAEASYRQAIVLKPDYAKAHYNLGNTLKELGRLDEAEASYRQAIVLKPDLAEAHYNLGVTLQELGRLDEAEASYRQAIALKPDYAEAHRNLTTTKKFSSKDEQFFKMQALYRDPAISENNRCHICFALAKASEDLEDCATAFQFYAEGNALRKKQLGYEKAKDKALFEKLKTSYPHIVGHTFEPEIIAPHTTPIFIVGMPRSGTTLVEQILSSHPRVTGAGELPFVFKFGRLLAVKQTPADGEALTTFRDQYLNALKQRSEGKAIVTDKMPQNFRFLGLIATALPEAKIIHVKRDPAAVCWANHTKYFINDSLGYCCDLDDILHYHELYQDLMSYWHQALPNRIYDLSYEVLTEHQEEETRKLIGHLGLEWNGACLSPQENNRGVATASNVQVRQKVYQGSSERWKRYKPYLNGALDRLGFDHQ